MTTMISAEDAIIELHNKLVRSNVLKAIKNKDLSYFDIDPKSPGDLVKQLMLTRLMNNNDITSKKSKQQIVWATITKADGCGTESFIKAIHSLKEYRFMKDDPHYCFESTNLLLGNEFKNIHAHYLCKKQIGINKAQYIKRLEKVLKDNVFNINIQIYDLSFYQDKIDYMNGKKDNDQYDKPEITNLFRTQYKLSALY